MDKAYSLSAPRVAALVLAAGSARRMGRQKLLLPLWGKPLIMPALAAAQAVNVRGQSLFSPVVAVLGPHSPEALYSLLQGAGVQCCTAHDAALGQAHSLRHGLYEVLRLCEAQGQDLPEGVCVLLGDQPLVGVPLMRLLYAAFAHDREAFVAPAHEGRRGTPVIIPRAFFEKVLRLEGDTGARPLLSAPEARLALVPVEEEAVLRDVDTEEDYAALSARADAS